MWDFVISVLLTAYHLAATMPRSISHLLRKFGVECTTADEARLSSALQNASITGAKPFLGVWCEIALISFS